MKISVGTVPCAGEGDEDFCMDCSMCRGRGEDFCMGCSICREGMKISVWAVP